MFSFLIETKTEFKINQIYEKEIYFYKIGNFEYKNHRKRYLGLIELLHDSKVYARNNYYKTDKFKVLNIYSLYETETWKFLKQQELNVQAAIEEVSGGFTVKILKFLQKLGGELNGACLAQAASEGCTKNVQYILN